MRDSYALRNTRQSAAKSLQMLAIGGVALTLCVTASAIWLTRSGNSTVSVSIPDVSVTTESNS